MSAKSRPVALLASGIALILCVLAFQLIFAGEKRLDESSGEATIVFSADKGLVAAPGACVTVRWRVENVQAVYINTVPTVGEGQKIICVDENTMPVLQVKFRDNAQSEYRLTIDFLIAQPSTWLLVTAALLLGLASVYMALVQPTPAINWATPRIFAAIGLFTTGMVITVVVLELALRFYFTNFGTEFQRRAYLYSRAEIEAARLEQIPLPYVEYGTSPFFPGHNSLGFRGDEIQVPKPSGVYRIVVTGGSSTYGATTPYDETYPYYLQQVLRDEYGFPNVEVVNAGVQGYTSWNSLVDLALRLGELQPDLVIVYHGINDVGARESSPDCYRDASPFLGLGTSRRLRAQRDELSAFALYRFIVINLGWMPNPAAEEDASVKSAIHCIGEETTALAENVAINPPIYFERNMREMIGIARINHIRIMFSTSAYDLDSPEPPEYWRTAVAEHNAITARLAQENSDVLFLDFAALAPTDDNAWNGFIHMSSAGNLALAQTFAQYLVDQGVVEQNSTP